MHEPQISLVIPVYNEEENLPILFEEIQKSLDASGRSWEAVFIDDGSRDGSLAVLRKLFQTDPRARYAAFAGNRGQSAAFKAGFAEARGEIIVTLDADLQNDPADIPRMVEAYEAQGADMVAGRRAKRQDTLAKRVGSRVGNAVRNMFTHDGISDTGCSLKVMRAEMAKALPMFTGMHRFLPALMLMEGAKIIEMDVNHRPRAYGESNYNNWKRGVQGLYDCIAVQWMAKRHFKYRIKERGGDDA
jgi:glycosyltransferase involved in cell wall biosynthesis